MRTHLMICLAALLAQTAAAEPLRLGVAGLVHGHARGFFNNALKREDIRIVGIAEPDAELSKQYATRYKLDPSLLHSKLEEMLDTAKPEAVVIYTSTIDHLKVVQACAARHIPVMMEKPLAVDMEQARAIADASRKGGIDTLVNYETTWYRSNHQVYDWVRQGALGEVRKMVAHDGHQGPKEIGVGPEFFDWLTDPVRNGGGALMDFGCYGADLMTWLMNGERPLTVTAVTQQIKPSIYPKVEDEATIIVTYPRAQGIIQGSWNWPADRKDLEVYGATGYAITVKRDDVRVRRDGHDPKSVETLVPGKPLPSPYDDSLSYFTAVVRKQIKPEGLSSLEINLVATEILDAAKRSVKSGKTIKLSDSAH